MQNTYIVHVIYGSEEDLRIVMARLFEHGFTFSFSGEYIYGNSSLEDFIGEFCSDIADRLRLETEHWADLCFNYEKVSVGSQVDLYVEGVLCGRVEVAPYYLDQVTSLLSKLCRLAASHSLNVQYNTIQLPR